MSPNFFRGKKFAGFLVGVLCYKWGGTVSPAKNYDWSTTLCSCGFTCGVWHCLVVWLQKTMIGASQQEVANISKGAPLLPGQLRCQERWDQVISNLVQSLQDCFTNIKISILIGPIVSLWEVRVSRPCLSLNSLFHLSFISKTRNEF